MAILVDLADVVGGYLHDVFVVQMDVWVFVGFLAQGLFTMRFIVQWLASERVGKSVIPIAFWFFSLSGGMMLFVYALYRKDPVFILGQGVGILIYIRNLQLIFKEKKLAQ